MHAREEQWEAISVFMLKMSKMMRTKCGGSAMLNHLIVLIKAERTACAQTSASASTLKVSTSIAFYVSI